MFSCLKSPATIALVLVPALLLAGMWLAWPTPTPVRAQTPTRSAWTFGDAEKLAPLDASIRESSGLAASRTRPGWLWTHEDSGGGPWLMRFDPTQGQAEKWSVRNAINQDWEDMASFLLDDRPYLLVADTGDNQRKRSAVALYIMPEPMDVRGAEGKERPAGPVPLVEVTLTLHVTYADGPRDCEAVAVDPNTRTVWLVSKEIDAGGRMYGRSGLYAVTLPPSEQWAHADEEAIGSPEKPLVLERIATLDTVMPTAMDLTQDGASLLIGTYGDGLLFVRDPAADPNWIHAVAVGPQKVSLPPRRQGEALCFSLDGDALYLTSENSEQPVWRIPVSSRPSTP